MLQMVTNRRKTIAYLTNGLNEPSVCGRKPPVNGWLPADDTEETRHKLSKGSCKAYLNLPRVTWLTLGCQLAYTDYDKKTGKPFKVLVPAGERVKVVWRADGLTYCDYRNTIIHVGRNRAHRENIEVIYHE